ncbi:MAG: response regulator [Bacteroidaceae bacterium]|nr:response regulator [Bacteroidaceae bacterium]
MTEPVQTTALNPIDGTRDWSGLFRHYTIESGLSSNTVRSVALDGNGFMWFGTDEGLDCFDGMEFHHIPFTRKDRVDEYISTLYSFGSRLWFGSDDGLYYVNLRSDGGKGWQHGHDKENDGIENEVVRINTCTRQGDSITSTVSRITSDADGNLWISTRGQGVFRLNIATNALTRYEIPQANSLINYVFIDSNSQVWALANVYGASLFRLNKSSNTFEMFTPVYEEQGMETAGITMLEDAKHNLWVGTWENGVHIIDPTTGRTQVMFHPSQPDGIRHIHSMKSIGTGEYLIGSDDGLMYFNVVTRQHKFYREGDIKNGGLTSRFIYSIQRDSEGGLWLGTFFGGVNYLSPFAGQFESFSQYSDQNKTVGTIFESFCEDSKGRVWMATDDGGLNCYDQTTHTITSYTTQNSQLSYNNVHALCMYGDDLWVGTYTGGINIINTNTGAFRNIRTNQKGDIDLRNCYSLKCDSRNNIWIGTMTGVNLMDGRTGEIRAVRELEEMVIDIDEDSNGILWFCTQGKGFFRYNTDTRSWKNYRMNNTAGVLPSNIINSATIQNDTLIWIATQQGLCRFNPQTEDFRRESVPVSSKCFSAVIVDGESLWLTTNSGLIHYWPSGDHDIQLFTTSDGLLSEHFMPNAALMTSSGRIYIGSVNGANSFEPSRMKINQVVPSVFVTKVEYPNTSDNTSVYTNFSANERQEMTVTGSPVVLDYDQNTVTIHYASLSYCSPTKNQYAIRMDGIDKAWNYVGNDTRATYTNLSDGEYIFRVKATNNDGKWCQQEAVLILRITPPFYKAWYAKILYVILIALALWWFVSIFRQKQHRRHNEEMRRLNAQKEKEMQEAKISFFTMIAHEIRTPVSLIIGPLEKLMRLNTMPKDAAKELDVIDSNSKRLLTLVNQLLDFRKIEQGNLKLVFASHNIREMLEAVCTRFYPTFMQNGTQFDVQYPDKDFCAVIDKEGITKVVSNLLTNANKYTRNHVLFSCQHHPDRRLFEIIVEDNGNGISKADQQRIFQPFFQAMDNKPGTGIGLSIVQDLVKRHQGTITVESEVGQGARFIVAIPTDIPPTIQEPSNAIAKLSAKHSGIPVSRHPGSNPQTAQPSNAEGAMPTLLIVDDNVEMLNFLKDYFLANYTVLIAEDGLQALHLLKNNNVTMVVSDWMMPNMDGAELCRQLRGNPELSHIPFIMLTAKTDNTSKVQSMDCGADAYIEKPFSLEYLEACIRNLVEIRRKLREKYLTMPVEPIQTLASNSTDNEFLTRLNAIIEENFSNSDLTVDFLAAQMGISRSGLFAKIQAMADNTPNELIQIVRLKKAAQLLARGDYRVNEVCYLVGFSNPSYFTKCFKKQFGVNPKDYTAAN